MIGDPNLSRDVSMPASFSISIVTAADAAFATASRRSAWSWRLSLLALLRDLNSNRLRHRGTALQAPQYLAQSLGVGHVRRQTKAEAPAELRRPAAATA